MCTVVVLFQVHPVFPLVIAANRDERYARPSSGPTRLAEPPAAVAGRDRRFGGTWFGINAAGVAVAVTDQGQADADPTRRSRGHLVLDALGCPSVDAVGALLDGLDAARYNPFSLLHADTRQAWIAYHTDPNASTMRRERLAPGLHAVVSSLGASHATWRAERVARLVDPAALAGLAAGPLVDSLATMLRHHGEDPAVEDSICRHNGDHGTVSSFVALLAADLAASRLYCAVGPPCQTTYEDYSGLLAPSAAGVGAKGDDRAVP